MRAVPDFLTVNLDALRARYAHEPVLEPVTLPAVAHSPETIADAAARLRDAAGDELPSTLFVIGCGLGCILDAIDHVSQSAEVLVLEPDRASARRFLEQRDWTAWIQSGRLNLFVGPEYPGAIAAWRPATVPAVVPVIVDPDLERQHPDAVQEAVAVVERLVQEARANAQARRANAGRYVLHTLANAAAIAREGDVASLTQLFPGRPAIIVGAGPSLDGRLAELAAVADRAIVIACAAAARPLMTAGIVPQFIVSVDPTETNAMHLSALPNPRGAWLVGEGSLHPTSFAPFDRRTFVFNVGEHHPWPWLRTLGIERGRLATWGSSATSALDLALRLGCSPIVFAGLDFAFIDGRPYCRGTTFESQWSIWIGAGQTYDQICRQLINRWPLTLETDAEGQSVRTAPHLVSFRNWMCQQVEGAPRVRFINATPGGILHHAFVEQSNLTDALGRMTPVDGNAIHQQIREKHRSTLACSDRLFASIDQIAACDPAAEAAPLGEWMEFTGRSIRPQTFVSALKSHEHDAWRRGQLHHAFHGSPLMASR